VSRINSVFTRPGHKALIAYITVGFPTIEATLRTVPTLAGNGCDIIELGIPFSDPLADGATIQRASFQALQNGISPQSCLEIAKQLSRRISTPLVFITYFNAVLRYGIEQFCVNCADSGIEGLIIPDLPPEEGTEVEAFAQRYGIDLIYLLAPTSSEERIRLVAEKSRGFIYLVSVTGVTGTRDKLPSGLDAFVARVRKIAKLPVCVGFGISTPEQAKQVAKIADGVIVGSRIIQLMEEEDKSAVSLQDFIKNLRKAIDEASN
jgi:tryptophan synthase alpha chain